MAKILCSDATNNVFWVHFVRPGQDAFSKSLFNLTGKKVIETSWLKLEYYSGWYKNEHHIQTKYYHKVIMPLMASYMPNFPFNIKDFKVVPFLADDEKYDVRYLVPKDKKMRFSLEVNGEKVVDNGTFDDLHRMKDKTMKEDGDTYFHKQYKGAHSCSILRNETINNNKSILVTGDSMMIPIIPILGCFYKEVVYLDNRDGKSYLKYYEGKIFTDVIIEVWEGFKIEKPLVENLK